MSKYKERKDNWYQADDPIPHKELLPFFKPKPTVWQRVKEAIFVTRR